MTSTPFDQNAFYKEFNEHKAGMDRYIYIIYNL